MTKPDDPDGERRRRRSTGLDARTPLQALTPIHSEGQGEPSQRLKKRRPLSFLGSSQASDPREESRQPDGAKAGRRSRPPSIFGSLRSRHSGADVDEPPPSPYPKDGSVDDDVGGATCSPSRVVRHHGEVQTTGGMFRKKREYLVLTDRHLVRFKNRAKASEVFPSIPASLGKSTPMRHASMSSIGSLTDLPGLAQAESQRGLALRDIVAVYKLEDGRPYFSIEVAHLDESISQPSSVILQLDDPTEAEIWLTSIRGAATKARLLDLPAFPQQTVEYVARWLERQRDYDPLHFRIFKVVQRPAGKTGGRSSSDDLARLASTTCYLAIGLHMVHLVPLPRHGHARRTSSASLAEPCGRAAFGLAALTLIHVRPTDDAFDLGFRVPLQPAHPLWLASTSSAEIALWVRQAVEYLRPQWLEQPLVFQAPRDVEESLLPRDPDMDDLGCFDRTLTAYCAAYERDTSNIRYAVASGVEDEPRISLLHPERGEGSKYSALELLAFFRALRYNEVFRSVSFAGIDLGVLHQLSDLYGVEHVSWTSRTGIPLGFKGQGPQSLLVRELQALALKSKGLRRLDLSYCVRRKPVGDDEGPADAGCEIVEALFPLCRRQLTNVDWITLNGIKLGESDLDYLVDAAVERACHLRALEISNCGLTDRSLQLVFNAMLSQDSTLESIDISGNLARLSPATFQGQIGHFSFIRKLNLSRVHRTSGPEPLVAPETLLTWRLQELHLSETALNAQTADSVAAYLASPMSDSLRDLRLNQCGLRGKEIAVFLRAMSREPGVGRELHLHVSENRIEEHHNDLVDAVAQSLTPTHLTMRMAVYEKEYRFRELMQALRRNTTLRYLDLSKASLPGDANEETCEALKRMFADNTTLEELDISGELGHLELAKFGIGLNHALTGLERNGTLRVLRIEYQKLGLQGASTLASVLERNTRLEEIYCSHNDITLQGLTVLVKSLAVNWTVRYIPSMDGDREAALETVKREYQAGRDEGPVAAGQASVRKRLSAVRGGLGATAAGQGHGQGHGQRPLTDSDLQAAVDAMREKWERQTDRLAQYLRRNAQAAGGPAGAAEGGGEHDENERPSTEASLSSILEQETPTAEKGDGLAEVMAERFGLGLASDGNGEGASRQA
ncbi:MAG: hypothetical protein M1832_003101 [Thelocarpon impressellum]|nr:MAG: hypothetical protein M1832_003101 [Thelocarpon impressellum]